jgi:hypothetical protein
MSLADARIAAAYFRKEVRDGIDPLLEKQKIELPEIEIVDQLFHDWHRTDLSRRLKHPYLLSGFYPFANTREVASPVDKNSSRQRAGKRISPYFPARVLP